MREKFEKLPEIEKIIKNGIHYNDRFNCYQSIDGISYLTIARINGAWYAFQEQQKIIDMQECGATEIQMILNDIVYNNEAKIERIKELLK